jgi:hypothetical protein
MQNMRSSYVQEEILARASCVDVFVDEHQTRVEYTLPREAYME